MGVLTRVLHALSALTGEEEPVGSTGGALRVYPAGLRAGENQVLDVTEVAPVGSAYRATATGTIITGPCIFYGFVNTAGTNPRITIYDGVNTSGVLLYAGGVDEVVNVIRQFPCAIECVTGLHVVLAGTTPAFTLFARA